MSPQGKVVRVLHDGKKAGNVTAWGIEWLFHPFFSGIDHDVNSIACSGKKGVRGVFSLPFRLSFL